MAKKEEASKTVLERVYSIPLRRETLKVPPFKKANKAVKTVKQFISRHMKSENVVSLKLRKRKLQKKRKKKQKRKSPRRNLKRKLKK
ncbi:hypothetical protein HYX04_05560 [Candidatus Woesearchaeota archaeon]|nr:hypothetical protein [Candidatus Woesearchaeota archaeon]